MAKAQSILQKTFHYGRFCLYWRDYQREARYTAS